MRLLSVAYHQGLNTKKPWRGHTKTEIIAVKPHLEESLEDEVKGGLKDEVYEANKVGGAVKMDGINKVERLTR